MATLTPEQELIAKLKPVLDLGYKPFEINGYLCGWDKENICFRPMIPDGENGEIWKFDPKVDLEKLKIPKDKLPKFTLKQLWVEYLRLRDLQDKDSESETNQSPDYVPKYNTLGLTDLMKWTGYKYQSPKTLRVYISKQNNKIIDTYNTAMKKKIGNDPPKKSNGKVLKNGWWSYNNPMEDLTLKEQRKKKYKSKLMKGLNLNPNQIKTKKKAAPKVGVRDQERLDILDMLEFEP